MIEIDELVKNKTLIIGHTRGGLITPFYYIRALPEYKLKQDIYANGSVILYPNTKVSFIILKAPDGKYYAYDIEVIPSLNA